MGTEFHSASLCLTKTYTEPLECGTAVVGCTSELKFLSTCYCQYWCLFSNVSKAVPLQAWSGPEGSRKLRFPDFMTMAQDGGKVVSLTHRPHLPTGNTPGTHFCQRLSQLQGHSATGRIMSLKNSNDTIGNRTRDLPVCSVMYTCKLVMMLLTYAVHLNL